MPQPLKPVEFTLPYKGIDQATRRLSQAAGTCPVAINVRGRGPLADRLGLCKRAGTRRALTDPINDEAPYDTNSKRVVGLSIIRSLVRSEEDGDDPETPDPANPHDLPEDPDDPIDPDYTPGPEDPSNPGTDSVDNENAPDDPDDPDDPDAPGRQPWAGDIATPTVVSRELIDDDFSSYAVADPGNLGDDYVSVGYGTAVAGVPMDYHGQGIEAGGYLSFDGPGGGATPYINVAVLAVNGDTTNDARVRMRCLRSVTTGAGARWGAAQECTGIGPFVRGSPGCKSFFAAILVPTAANTMQLKIVEVVGNTVTVRATSGNLVVTATAGLVNDREITLRPVGNVLTATVSWPTEVAGVPDTTVTYTTTTFAAYRRAGIALVFYTLNADDADGQATADFRWVSRFRATKIVYPEPDDYLTLDPTAASGSNYFLPSTWKSQHRTVTAATSGAAGATSAGDPTYPAIDNANNRILGSPQADVTSSPQWLAPATTPSRLRGIEFQCNLASTSGADCGGMVSRGSAAVDGGAAEFNTLLATTLRRSAGAGTTAVTGCTRLVDEIRVERWDGVVRTTAVAIQTAAIEAIPFRVTDRVRLTDDGTTIRLYVRGMLLWSYVPAMGSFTGSAVGVAMAHTNDLVTSPTLGEVRLMTGPQNQVTVAGDTLPWLLLQIGGQQAWIGNLFEDTQTPVTGIQEFSDCPSIAAHGNYWYTAGKDALGFRITPDTALSESMYDLTSEPDDTFGYCLVASFCGRLYWARYDAPPTFTDPSPTPALGNWLASKRGDPLDYDLALNVPVLAAIAGTSSPEVGVPAHEIVALIPRGDDYIVFAGPSAMAYLTGDPGSGGQMLYASRDSGVMHQRAWCHDDQGKLYYLGYGGLFRWDGPGYLPINLDRGRLNKLLVRIDLDTFLPQLVFDTWERAVRIFVTPLDSTQRGRHVAYIVETDALFEDQYPVAEGELTTNMGPWSVCEGHGTRDQDNRFLFGGNDGYVRHPHDNALGDDELRFKGADTDTGQGTGVAIYCEVRTAGIRFSIDTKLTCIKELTATGMDNGEPLFLPTGTVAWYLLGADAEPELANSPRSYALASGTWFDDNGYGLQESVGLSEAAVVMCLNLVHETNDSTFGFESIVAKVRPQGGAH